MQPINNPFKSPGDPEYLRLPDALALARDKASYSRHPYAVVVAEPFRQQVIGYRRRFDVVNAGSSMTEADKAAMICSIWHDELGKIDDKISKLEAEEIAAFEATIPVPA